MTSISLLPVSPVVAWRRGAGASVNSAEVRAGDVVIVVGIGGIGMSAVQGAAHAGASVLIAVDPVEWKR
jgi:S-(hydroxymethyl)glutathione dehydrogenase/alcohol dehydrogenase